MSTLKEHWKRKMGRRHRKAPCGEMYVNIEDRAGVLGGFMKCQERIEMKSLGERKRMLSQQIAAGRCIGDAVEDTIRSGLSGFTPSVWPWCSIEKSCVPNEE